jgi:hypothetical protein
MGEKTVYPPVLVKIPSQKLRSFAPGQPGISLHRFFLWKSKEVKIPTLSPRTREGWAPACVFLLTN